MGGLYYDIFSNDEECTSRQAKLPTVIGCFCSNSSFSFQTSCRNHRIGTVATYSDGVCGEEDVVRDIGDCNLQSRVDQGRLTVFVYSQIAECVIPNATFTSTEFFSTQADSAEIPSVLATFVIVLLS